MPADPARATDGARSSRGGRCPESNSSAPSELSRLPWMDAFLAALQESGNVLHAAGAVGIATSTVYRALRRYPRFKAQWDTTTPERARFRNRTARAPGPGARHPHWRLKFLAALAETSNVSASAAEAGVEPAIVYRTRRSDPEFAAKWQAALFEGYEHLELELLCHLRSPDPERKLDVAAALRLLAAHREVAIRLKALAGEEDEAAVRSSIDAFLEGMRQRRLANQAILSEAQVSEDRSGDQPGEGAGDVAR